MKKNIIITLVLCILSVSTCFAQEKSKIGDYFNKGMNSFFNKDYEKAIEYFSKEVKQNPEDAEAYATMSVAYSRLGKYNEAISAAKESVNLEPDNAFNYNELGLAYRLSGDYKKALDTYLKAVSLSSSSGDYNGLGLVYSALGKEEEAISSYQKALSQGSQEEVYLNLATSHKRLGQNIEVKECLLKARDIFARIKKDNKVLEVDKLLETIPE